MPFYDLTCKNDHQQFNLFLKVGERPPCPTCGEPTETLWIGKGNNIIQDSIEGGVLIEHGICNADGTPKRYYSKTEIARAAAEKGLIPFVRHVEGSKETTNWAAAMDPVTMENARILTTRGVRTGPTESAADRKRRDHIRSIAAIELQRLGAI